MKHLIIFILTCLIVYSIIAADPLENAILYKTDVQILTDLQRFTWLDSETYYIIKQACFKYGTDIDVVCAIIQHESSGNEKAINKHNRDKSIDYGLMMINSKHGYNTKKLLDKQYNIDKGCKYLSECMKKADSIEQAISFYNTGNNSDWYNAKYVEAVKQWL